MSEPVPVLIPVMTGLTWQDFMDLPGEIRHASLIDGDLFVNSPAFVHQVIVAELLFALVSWTKAGAGRGVVAPEPTVQINHNTGYMPDVAWWCHEKRGPAGQPPAVDGSPDLVVEVLSPSTRRMDSVRKRNDYPKAGVCELWLIDPDGPSAEVVRYGDRVTAVTLSTDDTLTSPLLPGFAVTVGDLTTW